MKINSHKQVQRCQALGIVPNAITDQPKQPQYRDHRLFNLKFWLRPCVKCTALQYFIGNENPKPYL